MYDIIIIGAGPAGMTAAIYASRAALKVLVLEANSYGGQIINTKDIENYPAEKHISGFDFAKKLYEQDKDLGADIVYERVINIKNGIAIITATNLSSSLINYTSFNLLININKGKPNRIGQSHWAIYILLII